MKLSVIIPVYNQEKLVIRALESIPQNDDIEIIIVDDGSTDNTWKVIQEYKDERIKAFHFSKNRGVSAARNCALDNAIGEYVVMLDSDDYFFTDGFNEVYNQLDGTDLIYYNLMRNKEIVWKITIDNRRRLCGTVKFMRRDFIGDTRYPEKMKNGGEDRVFNDTLLDKCPTEKFTDVLVLRYNYPRRGSLNWKYKGKK